MPASTLSGRSVALLRVNLGNYTSQGRSISHGNCTRPFFVPPTPTKVDCPICHHLVHYGTKRKEGRRKTVSRRARPLSHPCRS